MELNEYQKQAMSTCMDSSRNFSYMMLNLVGEVGELASKVAKQIRKGNIYIGGFVKDDSGQILSINTSQEWDSEFKNELMKEAGDVIWQVAGLCEIMGWTLEEVAQANLDKLSSRKARNVIDGNGDNR